jgi:hypothetical protein
MEHLKGITNTVAYHGTELLTVEESFIVHRAYSQRFIFFVTYEFAQ